MCNVKPQKWNRPEWRNLKMRFGVCASLENAALLAETGWDYIEPTVAGTLRPEQVEREVMPPLQAALAAGLRAETFNVLLPGDLKVVGEDGDEKRQNAYLESAFARAQALGGAVVVFGSGGARRIPDDFPPKRARAQTVSFLQRAGDAAARHGLSVAIEPLNRGECNFINSVAEAVALAEFVAHPAVGVLSDLYHVTVEGQSYDETRAAARWLRHVHVAGAENRRAPVAADTAFLAGFFRVLKEIGYSGRISVEGSWNDLPAQAADTLAVLRHAWETA